jgi:diguanylate cyclase (GGDEF)-like protein/PAS domain S-box-containing protein
VLPTPRASLDGEASGEVLGELWQVAAQQSEDAVIGVDTAGRVIAWSSGAERLFGYSAEDVTGRSGAELFVEQEGASHAARVRRALMGERLANLPLNARRRDGLIVPVAVTLVSLSERKALCLVVRDLTEQHFSQQALAESELRLLEAQELAHVGLWLWDEHSDTFQMSQEMHTIHSLDPREFAGTLQAYFDLVHRDDRFALQERMIQALHSEAPLDGVHRVIRPDGETRWLYARATPEPGPTGEPVGLRGICQDITAVRQGEEVLRRQAAFMELLHGIAVAANEASSLQEALRSCVDELCSHAGWSVGHAYVVQDQQATSSGIWQSTDESRLEQFRATAQAHVGRDEGGLVGQVLQTGGPVWISDLADYVGSTRLRTAAKFGLATAFGFPVVVGNEMVAILEFFSTDRREPDRQLIHTAQHGANQLGRVVERSRLREALAQHALHDALTELPNRILLMDRLTTAVQRLDREGASLAVIFLDLDDFKLINDSLGHHIGDTVLTSVAKRLARVMRPGDTLARFGGDEFVVLCEHLADEHVVTDVVSRLLAAIARPMTLPGGMDVVVSASAGIALARTSEATPQDLIRDADSAMYRAKEEGGDRQWTFDPGMHQRASRRLMMANELRRAIDQGQLRVYFQPQVRTSDRIPVAFEALVRWEHPERGLLSPTEFIDVAEETQLIVPLGAWVLRESCRVAAEWCQLGGPLADLMVCVNVSALQLGRPELLSAVSEALEENHLPAHHLCLEITESVLMTDADETLRVLMALKAIGVSLAIDDFGTGYSSLAYMSRFPIDVIKIDKGFVDGLGRGDHRAVAIVQAVVDLSLALGVRPVAEGVERIEQVRDLATIGCGVAQGYFFSQPQPAAAFMPLLRAQAGGG